MTKLYQIEVTLAATLYVKADSEQAALEIANATAPNAHIEVEDAGSEVPISGAMFDDPELPEISLSPAMTLSKVHQHVELTEGADED